MHDDTLDIKHINIRVAESNIRFTRMQIPATSKDFGKKFTSPVRRLTCLMYGYRNLGRDIRPQDCGIKPLGYRISAETTLVLLREAPWNSLGTWSHEAHQGAKWEKWADLCRSGEGQARLGATDVFLRVYYVSDSSHSLQLVEHTSYLTRSGNDFSTSL